jgi:4a-hydroxytetrahydrobiopterin dehydratase
MNNWKEENDALTKTFVFADFAAALTWMVKAGFVIDRVDHHPEWTNVYNKVHVKLTTHDSGNKVTDKDRKLAALLDAV